jgi:F-type H+-transporting ATPase subunit epsilon
MAEPQLHIELSSPIHPPIAMDAEQVVIPGEGGILTVYPGHTPLLSTVNHGVVIVDTGAEKPKFFAVHRGFAEILDNRVLILADGMESADSIDDKRAEAAMARAEERINKPPEDLDLTRALSALARAEARLQARRGEGY